MSKQKEQTKSRPWNGPGNNGFDVGSDLKFLDDLLGDSNMPSMAKEFVDPGDSPLKLLMRTIFKDERQANSAAEYLAKCKDCEDKEGEEMLLCKLAGMVSVNGLSRRELAMVLSQRIVPALYGLRGEEQKYTGAGHKEDEGP